MPEFDTTDCEGLYIWFGNPFDSWRELWQGPCCHGEPSQLRNCADADSYWAKLDGECKVIKLESEIGL